MPAPRHARSCLHHVTNSCTIKSILQIVREVQLLVYDEIHYLRDKERGVVWVSEELQGRPACWGEGTQLAWDFGRGLAGFAHGLILIGSQARPCSCRRSPSSWPPEPLDLHSCRPPFPMQGSLQSGSPRFTSELCWMPRMHAARASGVTDPATAPAPHSQGLHAMSCTPTTVQRRWNTTCFLLGETGSTSWWTPRAPSGVQACSPRGTGCNCRARTPGRTENTPSCA